MQKEHPFVERLERLREDRGALADLRRGLGHSPGATREMYRYIVPWVPAGASQRREATYYLIASLFAYHPAPGGEGNIGSHFARTLAPGGDHTAVERRLATLLAAHPDDLSFHLRQAVGYLKSKEVPVNWNQLFADVQAWGHPDGYVQKQWARAFWGRTARPEEDVKEE